MYCCLAGTSIDGPLVIDKVISAPLTLVTSN